MSKIVYEENKQLSKQIFSRITFAISDICKGMTKDLISFEWVDSDNLPMWEFRIKYNGEEKSTFQEIITNVVYAACNAVVLCTGYECSVARSLGRREIAYRVFHRGFSTSITVYWGVKQDIYHMVMSW